MFFSGATSVAASDCSDSDRYRSLPFHVRGERRTKVCISELGANVPKMKRRQAIRKKSLNSGCPEVGEYTPSISGHQKILNNIRDIMAKTFEGMGL